MEPDAYKYTSLSHYKTADHLIKMKNTKDMWTVIGEVLRVWSKEKPREYKSFLVSHKDLKSSRKSSKVGHSRFTGVTRDKKTGGILRFSYSIPVKVMTIIRKLYPAEVLNMDKEFFEEFGKRFPKFRISEKE
jgi:hypothetical protein